MVMYLKRTAWLAAPSCDCVQGRTGEQEELLSVWKRNKFPHEFQCLPESIFLFTTEWPELHFYIYRWSRSLKVIKRPLHHFRFWSLKQNTKKFRIVSCGKFRFQNIYFQADVEQKWSFLNAFSVTNTKQLFAFLRTYSESGVWSSPVRCGEAGFKFLLLICWNDIEISNAGHSPSQSLLEFPVITLYWAFSWGKIRKIAFDGSIFSLNKCTPWVKLSFGQMISGLVHICEWRCPFFPTTLCTASAPC